MKRLHERWWIFSVIPEEVGWAGVYVDLESINYDIGVNYTNNSPASHKKGDDHLLFLDLLELCDSLHEKIRPPNQHQTLLSVQFCEGIHIISSQELQERQVKRSRQAGGLRWEKSPFPGKKPWLVGWLVGWVGSENIAGQHGSFFFSGGAGGGLKQGKRRWWWKWALKKKQRSHVVSYIKPKTEREREWIPFCKIVKMPMPQVSWHKFTQLWVCWQEISWGEPALQTMNVPSLKNIVSKSQKGVMYSKPIKRDA